MLSFYGKLPTTGDFLTVEVPRDLLRPVEDWLATSLARSREMIEDDWQGVFDAAPEWRFWIGEAVLGRRIAGIMRPSRDKVGRRFPALIFACPKDPELAPDAPVVDPDETFFQGLGEELDYLAGQTPDVIQDRLRSAGSAAPTGLGEPDGEEAITPSFWAVAPSEGPAGWDELIDDAAPADHARATAARSYWWAPHGAGSRAALYATTGLPGPEVFSWFLTGLGQAGFALPEEDA